MNTIVIIIFIIYLGIGFKCGFTSWHCEF